MIDSVRDSKWAGAVRPVQRICEVLKPSEPLEDLGSPLSQRTLRDNFFWAITGNVVYGATQWAILVLLARMGSPEAVGEFSLGLAITAPMMLFSGLQLRAVQATDARGLFQFPDYASVRVLTTAAAISVVWAMSLTSQNGDAALTVAAFGLAKGIESLSDLSYGLWQQNERMDWIAQSQILRGVFGLAAGAACFATTRTVWIAVCGLALGWAVIFAAFDLRHTLQVARGEGQGLWPSFSQPEMMRLVKLALPLGVVTALLSFNGNIPRYLISGMQGERELGIFSALGYGLLAGGILVNALGQSATSRLAKFSSQGKRSEFYGLLNRLLLMGLGLGAIGVLVAVIAGRQIITIVYGREYAQNTSLLVWLMVAAAISYMASFAGYGLTAGRHFRVQVPLFGFMTILTATSCYVMVQTGGAVGAAKALAFCALAQLIIVLASLRVMEPRQREVL